MKQTRKMKRRRRRRLRKGFKVLFIATPIIVALVFIVVYGFSLKSIETSLDLNQYTTEEVKAYLDNKKIDNTLLFWIKNKIGKSDDIELLSKYSVKMLSPSKVKIIGYENKLKGYVVENNVNCYFDRNGKVLKISSDKLKSIPKVEGLRYNKITLYQKIDMKKEKALNSLLTVVNSIEQYNYTIKKVIVNDSSETSLVMDKLQVDLGKTTNLDKKLKDLNDMYDEVKGYDGVLNMKIANEEGMYTIKKNDNSTGKKSKK